MAVAHVGVTWGVQRLSRGTMSLAPAQVSLVGPPTITCHQVMAIVSPTRPRGVKFRLTQCPFHTKPARSRKICYNISHAKHSTPRQCPLRSGEGNL